MSLSFVCELNADHVREATAGIFRRQLTKPLVLAGVVLIMLVGQGVLWAVLPQANAILHGMLFVMMVLTVVGTVLFANRYYQAVAVRNFQRFAGQPAKIRLEEDAYHYEAQWGQGSIVWDQFDSLWSLPGVWVLLQHAEKGVSVLLPSAALDDEARGFLKRKINERGGQIQA